MSDDAQQQFGVGLRFGTIVDVASKPPRYKVAIADADEMITPWLQMLHGRSKGDRSHQALEKGEQVALLLDHVGESGVILGAVYSEADPAPEGTWVKDFSDGTRLTYDKNKHLLTVDCVGDTHVTASKTITLKSPNIILDADQVTVKKDLVVQGKFKPTGGIYGSVAWSGDILLNSKSVNLHYHVIPNVGNTDSMH